MRERVVQATHAKILHYTQRTHSMKNKIEVGVCTTMAIFALMSLIGGDFEFHFIPGVCVLYMKALQVLQICSFMPIFQLILLNNRTTLLLILIDH